MKIGFSGRNYPESMCVSSVGGEKMHQYVKQSDAPVHCIDDPAKRLRSTFDRLNIFQRLGKCGASALTPVRWPPVTASAYRCDVTLTDGGEVDVDESLAAIRVVAEDDTEVLTCTRSRAL